MAGCVPCYDVAQVTHPDLTPRFRGCLLGGAVGDALGAAVEFMRLPEIQSRFGAAGTQDYAEVYGRRGAITDDTQMTLFTAEGLIRCRAARARGVALDPVEALHRAYLRWLHTQAQRSASPNYDDALDGWLIRVPALHSQRAPGNTCLSALTLAQAGSVQYPINDSKGCGGVMRVAPVGLLGERPFEIGCQACAITHGHPAGYLAGGAFAALIAYVTGGTPIAQAVARVRDELGAVLGGEVGAAIDAAMLAARRRWRSRSTARSRPAISATASCSRSTTVVTATAPDRWWGTSSAPRGAWTQSLDAGSISSSWQTRSPASPMTSWPPTWARRSTRLVTRRGSAGSEQRQRWLETRRVVVAHVVDPR